MQITMNDSRIASIAQLRDFLKGIQTLPFSLEHESIEKKYEFIDEILKRFAYRKLSRKDKKVVIWYVQKVTGYKKEQVYQLVARFKKGSLKRSLYKRVKPHKIYTITAIKLLEKTDELHLRLSEQATKEILRREFSVFGKNEYQTIAGISHGHITNLRHADSYRSFWINHTKARQTSIGSTQPPQNFGRPGSIRIDSVSQKDVFHINSVMRSPSGRLSFVSHNYRKPACYRHFMKSLPSTPLLSLISIPTGGMKRSTIWLPNFCNDYSLNKQKTDRITPMTMRSLKQKTGQ